MKILMVCLGNICRSPLAEGILRMKISNLGLECEVDSAGTSNWHEGNQPHKGSIDIAKKHGIDITDQISRQFTSDDFKRFDLILAMDSDNYQNIIKQASIDSDIEKVKLLLNYAYPGRNIGVPDPYYTDNFQEVYDLLDLACTNLVSQL